MALSQSQWYELLKANLPEWFFEKEDLNAAIYQGIAKAMATVHEDLDCHFDETNIDTATTETLDETFGDIRTIPRFPNEQNDQYRQRLKNLSNQSNCPDIKAIVDLLLIVGESTIIEDDDSGVFCNREHFLNRRELLIDPVTNAFSIVVDQQLHEPYSFCDRENFSNREDYVGQAESSQFIFDLIVEAVSRNKLCGTFYRIIELVETA